MATSDYKVDLALTKFSVGFGMLNDGSLVGDTLWPAAQVTTRNFQYFTWDQNDLRLRDNERARGTVGQMGDDLSGSYTAAATVQHALVGRVTDEDAEDSAKNLEVNLAQMRVKRLTNQMMLAEEQRSATLFNTSGGYGGTAAIGAAHYWDDPTLAGSDPLDDIRTARAAMLPYKPNTLGIPYNVQILTEGHPVIVDLLKYTRSDLLENGAWPARVLGMDVVTPGAYKLSNIKGATDAHTALYNDSVSLVVLGPVGLHKDDMSFGKTFRYPTTANIVVKRWREDPNEAEMVKVHERGSLKKITNAAAGYLLTDALKP